MFGCNAFMPTFLKLLLPKLRYMGDEGYKLYMDDMREIYMMAVLNLKLGIINVLLHIEIQTRLNSKVGDVIYIMKKKPCPN